MVDPSSENDGVLREWAPLLPLLSQIPPKAQRGLFTGDLNLTCIAALPDYLAIGTNHGLVYWYNRATNDLQRLRCENTLCAITCIAVISTVDIMIAAGTSSGVVTVFLVPKAFPENIPDVFKSNSKKQMERYTVGGLHTASVSSIEWSPNGMKLFSGDQKGAVVLTEIDFYMHLSKSVEILNEKYEVVQLSYNSSNQLLLVSTLYRTILCHKNSSDGIWNVSQVGSTERKTLGKMGATFCNNPQNPRSPVTFCSRPGLRLWIGNKDGIVEKTLMFKDSVLGHHPLIQLLNPTRSRARQSRGEPQLGPLLVFKDQLLVTYTTDALLVLDPHSISVVAALYDVQRISALCVTKSEIFILEGERHLIRIGFSPEAVAAAAPNEDSGSKGSPLANQILELTAKLRDTSIISAIPIKKLSPIFSPTKSSGSSDGEQLSECMEAQELPPVVSLDSLDLGATETLPELHVSASSFTSYPADKEVYTKAQRSIGTSNNNTSMHSELLDRIAQEQFEEVVFQPKKKTKKNRSKHGTGAATGAESGSDTTSMISTTSENDEVWNCEKMDASSEWSSTSVSTSRRSSVDIQPKQAENCPVNTDTVTRQEVKLYEASDKTVVERSDTFLTQSLTETASTGSLLGADPFLVNSLNVDHHNKDEFEQIVVTKERMVAKKYNLESVLGIAPETAITPQSTKLNGSNSETSQIVDLEIKVSKRDANSEEDSEEGTLQSIGAVDTLRSTSDEGEYFLDDKMTSFSSTVSYGPPSGSSQLPSRHSSLDLDLTSPKDETANTALRREAMEASGWLQFNTPQPVVWVAVCSHYLAAIDASDSVHYCSLGGLGLRWQRADCKASQLALSPNAHCVWRLHNNIAYALKNPSKTGPHGEVWLEAATNVRSIAVGEDSAWIVTQDGRIYCQKDLTPESPISEPIKVEISFEWTPVKIVCFSQIVWLLTPMGEVYVRLGVSSAKPEGVDWKRVNIPVPGSVVDISLGSQRTGWIVDNNDTIMFSVDHLEHEPHWWQVLISDYIFQQKSPLQILRSTIGLKSLRPTLPAPSSCVASGKDSVWITRLNSNTLHVNKTKITGHSWTRIKLKGSPTSIRWQAMSAEGIFESGGQLWLLSADGDLYCSQPYNNKNLKQIPLPTSDGAVCLAASSQALWVLTSSGEIYIRQGLSDTCLEGNSWRGLSLMQIEGTHLTHISCGLDVVWACDTKGSMYMTVSSPHAMATATFSPVWIRVPDSKEQKKIFFVKVFVGSQTYMVWALDDRGKIYVREAIFPDFPLGTDWVAVTGIKAVALSVSASAVWALTMEGDVYRRHGITENNYIGDYWKKIPGSVEALTASMCDRLWGTDKSGSLLRHNQLTVNLNPNCATPAVPQPLELANTGEVGDWEVVDITNPVVI